MRRINSQPYDVLSNTDVEMGDDERARIEGASPEHENLTLTTF